MLQRLKWGKLQARLSEWGVRLCDERLKYGDATQRYTQIHTPDSLTSPHGAYKKTCSYTGWLYGCRQWLPSSQVQSFFCLASFRTTLSRSLRDFCSSSRNCFIHLFSWLGRKKKKSNQMHNLQIDLDIYKPISLGDKMLWPIYCICIHVYR